MDERRPQANSVAIDLLSRREHSASELKRKLKLRGFDDSDASEAVAKLSQQGLQSDFRFLESFLRSRAARGHGPSRIRAELAQRGCDITPEAEDAFSDYDWKDLAAQARLKKFGKPFPRDAAARAKQMRFLQYRGFGNEHIRYAMQALPAGAAIDDN